MSGLSIELKIIEGISTQQTEVMHEACGIWSQVLTDKNIEPVDSINGVLIEVSGKRIDGEGGQQAIANPTHFREDNQLPFMGNILFDKTDLAKSESTDSLFSLAVHEIGHVLGFGTLWKTKKLIKGSGTANPVFVGVNAQEEFGRLLNQRPRPVPIENEGGPGTTESHWREKVFGGELMTSILDVEENPLSRLTIASFKDLGYEVSFDLADSYEIPDALELSMMGVWANAELKHTCSMCSG